MNESALDGIFELHGLFDNDTSPLHGERTFHTVSRVIGNNHLLVSYLPFLSVKRLDIPEYRLLTSINREFDCQ